MNRRRRRVVDPSEVLPRPAPDVIDDGVPATEEVPGELLRTGDIAEGPAPPGDGPVAAGDWGTTPEEQRRGEPLDVILAREEPDAPVVIDESVAGHLYQPGAESWADDEPAEVGDVDAIWEDTLSAEESAVHIVDDPPGATDDESPGYLDGD